MGYLLIFVLYYGIGTIIMYTFGATFMKFFERWIKCPQFGEASCFGASLILRVSLALVILFFLMFVMMLPKDDFSYSANRSCWILKYLLPLGLTIAFSFVGNPFFEGYATLSKYGGILYLIMQDLAFNEYFIRFSVGFIVRTVNNYCYKVMYWILTGVVFAAGVLFVSLDFRYNYTCGSGKFLTIATIVIMAVNLVLTLLRTRNDVSMLSTAMYNTYIAYYLYSGMSSDTNPECTSLNTSSNWVLSEILINIGLIIWVFLLMTFSAEMPVFHIKTPDQH